MAASATDGALLLIATLMLSNGALVIAWGAFGVVGSLPRCLAASSHCFAASSKALGHSVSHLRSSRLLRGSGRFMKSLGASSPLSRQLEESDVTSAPETDPDSLDVDMVAAAAKRLRGGGGASEVSATPRRMETKLRDLGRLRGGAGGGGGLDVDQIIDAANDPEAVKELEELI